MNHREKFLSVRILNGRRGGFLRMAMPEFVPRLPDHRERRGGDTMGVGVDLGEERVRKFDGFAHGDGILAVVAAGGGLSSAVGIGTDSNRERC